MRNVLNRRRPPFTETGVLCSVCSVEKFGAATLLLFPRRSSMPAVAASRTAAFQPLLKRLVYLKRISPRLEREISHWAAMTSSALSFASIPREFRVGTRFVFSGDWCGTGVASRDSRSVRALSVGLGRGF